MCRKEVKIKLEIAWVVVDEKDKLNSVWHVDGKRHFNMFSDVYTIRSPFYDNQAYVVCLPRRSFNDDEGKKMLTSVGALHVPLFVLLCSAIFSLFSLENSKVATRAHDILSKIAKCQKSRHHVINKIGLSLEKLSEEKMYFEL